MFRRRKKHKTQVNNSRLRRVYIQYKIQSLRRDDVQLITHTHTHPRTLNLYFRLPTDKFVFTTTWTTTVNRHRVTPSIHYDTRAPPVPVTRFMNTCTHARTQTHPKNSSVPHDRRRHHRPRAPRRLPHTPRRRHTLTRLRSRAL